MIQNATDVITRCDSNFTTKCDKSILQNASGFFLVQNATVLLQNVTVTTKCDDFVTKSDVYFKIRLYIAIQ